MSYEQQHANIAQDLMHLNDQSFERLALDIFQFQATFNPVYSKYLEYLHIIPSQIKTLDNIPYLPIQFFKNYSIKTGEWPPSMIFSSSGTTGSTTSKHFVKDLVVYQQTTLQGFEPFYGSPSDFCILALLPSYLERQGSSLIFMAEQFIRLSSHPQSGFFLNDLDKLTSTLHDLVNQSVPTLLLGVSFALLDLAESHPMDLKEVIIMETGGMKGRRKELTRTELHQQLTAAFNVPVIHSEYGMTELFSQAYSKGNGLFFPAPSMRVSTREITDPLSSQSFGKTGALNIIDLANYNTISFIATDDLGRTYENGAFEVMGRLDHSDIRGCNLMVSDL